MEAQIEGKGVSTKLIERDRKGTSKYSRYAKGVRPRKETHDAVEKKYPGSNLRYWHFHPIGVLLLIPDLSYDQIITALEWLPKGEARGLIWDERQPSRWEVPDSEEHATELAALQSIDGLTAILGRIRLRFLLGQTEDVDLYETALLDCFPEVTAHSVHLSIARYSLMQALSDFLNWQCGWAEIGRKLEEETKEPDIGNFWPYLWRRFQDASSTAPSDWPLILDAEHVLRQRQMEDSLELGKSTSMTPNLTRRR